MSNPVLTKLDASPPACAVRMLAEIIGLQLDYTPDPDWTKLEHKTPEYLKLNPMGTIPVLQDGDFVLSDSHAIMKYLLSKYGGAKHESLYPSELRARALVDQCMYFNTGVFFIRLKVVALSTMLHGLKGPTEQHLLDLEDGYRAVESYLSRHSHAAGDHLTLADLALVSSIAASQAVLKVDPDKFPHTVAWLARMEQESFYQKIMAPGVAILTHALNMMWNKNNQQ